MAADGLASRHLGLVPPRLEATGSGRGGKEIKIERGETGLPAACVPHLPIRFSPTAQQWDGVN